MGSLVTTLQRAVTTTSSDEPIPTPHTGVTLDLCGFCDIKKYQQGLQFLRIVTGIRKGSTVPSRAKMLLVSGLLYLLLVTPGLTQHPQMEDTSEPRSATLAVESANITLGNIPL